MRHLYSRLSALSPLSCRIKIKFKRQEERFNSRSATNESSNLSLNKSTSSLSNLISPPYHTLAKLLSFGSQYRSANRPMRLDDKLNRRFSSNGSSSSLSGTNSTAASAANKAITDSIEPPPLSNRPILPQQAHSAGTGDNKRLLAGYLAHEYLTRGTLFGRTYDPSGRAERSGSENAGKEVYVHVANLLREEGGVHLPGIVNPSQLALFLQTA